MGAVFALFAGWYYWTPKILGLDYNRLLSKVHFWILFIGVNTTWSKVFYLSPINLWLKGRRRGKRFIHRLNKADPSPGGGRDGGGGNPSRNDNFAMFFENVQSNKRDIYKQLKGKAGVYLFTNKKTGYQYVGSSITLSKRMASHFYHANSSKDTKIVLYRAMRKYKLENFSLAIIEFCAPDLIVCSDLEQKWMDYYKPRYNVLKIAGSSSGFRHSIETINKLKEQLKKENHPKYGSVTSAETRQAISDGIKEFYRTHTHPAKGLKGVHSRQYGINGKFVFCYSKTGKELIFPSINGAKQHFKVRWSLVKKNLDTGNWITLDGEKWIIRSTPYFK
jgi:group I intron endonuclease